MFVSYDDALDSKGKIVKDCTTQFECLNELKDASSRCYDNLLRMNRFLFECDSADKSVQRDRAIRLVNDKIACRAVDSANKSIHVIIQLDRDATSVDEYKQIWKLLNKKFFNYEADTACSNPNRLTRCPNAIRFVNGISTVQKLVAQSDAQYHLTNEDIAALNSKSDVQTLLSMLEVKRVASSNDGICKDWNVIARYLNTPFLKTSGNLYSAKWLFAAVKTCQKYKDNATLQTVLNKARSEHWSEKELSHIQSAKS